MGRSPKNGGRPGEQLGIDCAPAASPWATAGSETSLDEVLGDPIVGLVLRRDRLTAVDVRAAVQAPARHCRERAAGQERPPAPRDGEGTRFARSLLGADAAPKGDGDRDLRGLKVLVAEDEALIALDLDDALRGFGCEVTSVAPSTAAALEALRAGLPDAALLDVGLRDGWSTPLAEALAAAGVPFAVLTGYDGSRIEQEPALRGAPRLVKPCGRAVLRDALACLAGAFRRLPRASGAVPAFAASL